MSNNLNQGTIIEASPCPFCGGKAIAQTCPVNGIHHAGCADSECIGHMAAYDFTSEQTAIEAWNRRTPAAATGDGELPPLHDFREDEAFAELMYEAFRVFTALDVRNTASAVMRKLNNYLRDRIKDAIKADRAQLAGAAAPSVKTWQERQAAQRFAYPERDHMLSEIADLRAQLAVNRRRDA